MTWRPTVLVGSVQGANLSFNTFHSMASFADAEAGIPTIIPCRNFCRVHGRECAGANAIRRSRSRQAKRFVARGDVTEAWTLLSAAFAHRRRLSYTTRSSGCWSYCCIPGSSSGGCVLPSAHMRAQPPPPSGDTRPSRKVHGT
jgi:hypothetical protein